MSSTRTRLIGVLCLIAAAVLFVLNLKRVADLGTFWVALPLLLAGLVLIARSRKHA